MQISNVTKSHRLLGVGELETETLLMCEIKKSYQEDSSHLHCIEIFEY